MELVPPVLGTVNVDVSVAVVINEKRARVVHRLDPLLHLQSLLHHPQGF